MAFVSVALLTPVAGAAPTGTRAGATLGAVDGSLLLLIGICAAALIVMVVLWRRDVIRPGSFARVPPRDLSGLPVLVWFAAAVAVLAAEVLGANFANSLPAGWLGSVGSTRRSGIIGLVAHGCGVACGVFLVYLLLPRASPAAGLRFRSRDLLIGLGAFVLAWPVLYAIGIVSIWITTLISGAPKTIAHSTLEQILKHRTDPWVYAVIASAVLGAPIVEELTFRVFLQSALRRLLGAPWVAVLVTSALFALTHLQGDVVPWHALPELFAVGLAGGIAYERTRRPGVPIMMHACFNLFNVALALLFPDAAGGG